MEDVVTRFLKNGPTDFELMVRAAALREQLRKLGLVTRKEQRKR